MSHPNVEFSREGFEAVLGALNARDFDALADLLGPAVEFNSVVAAAEGAGAYRGIDGLRKWAEEVDAVSADLASGNGGLPRGQQQPSRRRHTRDRKGEGERSAPRHSYRKRADVAAGRGSLLAPIAIRTRLLKPWGCRSRRCRARTSRSSSRRMKRLLAGTWMRSQRSTTRRSNGKRVGRTPTRRRIVGGMTSASTSSSTWRPSPGFALSLEECIDCGDGRVVASVRYTGRARASGLSMEWRQTMVYTFSAGKFVRAVEYFDHAEALEAVGLRA